MTITLHKVRFAYPGSSSTLFLPDTTFPSGSHTAIVGPSGCGKTTLLHLIAGILPVKSGNLTVGSHHLENLSDSERRNFRIRNIGFVFQNFELIEYCNTLDNILVPYRLNRHLPLPPEAPERAQTLAKSLGLPSVTLQKPVSQLSQGERQRVALCRSLITQPKILLADEPTGNLDPENKTRLMDLLIQQLQPTGATLLLVTHDHQLLRYFPQTLDATRWNASTPSHP